MIRAILSWLRPVDPELDLLRHMDRVAALIDDLDRLIRRTAGTNEQRYWMAKWEEAVAVHMDFEWHFHPANRRSA